MTCHLCVALDLTDAAAAQEGRYVCRKHEDDMYQMLDDVRAMYAVVRDSDWQVTRRDPPSSFTKSRPPVSLHTLSLSDTRTRFTRKDDPINALRVLKAWAGAVEESTGQAPDPTVLGIAGITRYLRKQLPWITRQPQVERFARHLAACYSSLNKELQWNEKRS